MAKPTFNDACEAVARSLRDFGYPDASAQMVSDTYDAIRDGKDVPHGIVGAFAAEQIKGERALFDMLSANT